MQPLYAGLKKFINGILPSSAAWADRPACSTLLIASGISLLSALIPAVDRVFPALGETYVPGHIQTPLGTSLPATDTVARYVERESAYSRFEELMLPVAVVTRGSTTM